MKPFLFLLLSRIANLKKKKKKKKRPALRIYNLFGRRLELARRSFLTYTHKLGIWEKIVTGGHNPLAVTWLTASSLRVAILTPWYF